MAQLSKGTTYVEGGQVTFSNLNALVDNAVLVGGAVSDQVAVSSVSQSDTTLINQSGNLRKATIGQIKTSLNLDEYLKVDGSTAMTTGQQLTLGSTTQISALDAVSFAYLNANFLKKSSAGSQSGYETFNGVLHLAGVGSGSGSLVAETGSTVILGQNPVQDLEAATKQYVDNSKEVKAKVQFSGQYADGVIVTCTYSRPSGSQVLTITCNSLSHGLKVGHRLFFNATSGALADNSYSVNSISQTDNRVFTVLTSDSTAISGSGQFVKALTHGNLQNVDSIIFATAGNDGGYFLNFTNSFSDENYCPLFSVSSIANESTGTRARGYIAEFDILIGTPEKRGLNSITFSTGSAAEFTAAGYRAGIVVF